METDPYDTRHSSSPLGRTARGAGGWLRRHGNTISARIGVVGRDGLDACVYE